MAFRNKGKQFITNSQQLVCTLWDWRVNAVGLARTGKA